MRPGAEYFASAPAQAANGTAAAAPHSPWQSPVPYLFGGLAAMLGLIAFALLILACSYWKLSGYLDGGSASGQGGSTAGEAEGEKGSAAGAARPAVGFREHVVVIMAGDERPTFLAMPATSRPAVELGAIPVASSCGDGGCSEHGKKIDASCGVSSPRMPRPDADADADAASRRHESSSNTRQQESSQ
ncbi:protein GLUTAMINE DUMPER 3-like [Oryza brachyantha]|uniref:protein GLUTAMINE DUMPER 3-like n=1 Tax=Oryza brachyantha TaxID=4533 RepID=UPI001ADBFF80|nr:protein GLUTAMINE DUMPER 3-like [Oryza brachyantha]